MPCHDTPALFTRIVTGPNSFSVRATIASTAEGLRDIGHRRDGTPAVGHNLTGQPIRRVSMCGIVHAYRRAALRQKSRRCSADASSTARHECHLVAPRSHISPVSIFVPQHTPAEICNIESIFSVAPWHGLKQQLKRFPESYCSSRFPFVVAKAYHHEIVRGHDYGCLTAGARHVIGVLVGRDTGQDR